MKIIKRGDPKRLKTTKEFRCWKCGCEFEAEKGEYSYAGMQYNESYYKCICPYCGIITSCSE